MINTEDRKERDKFKKLFEAAINPLLPIKEFVDDDFTEGFIQTMYAIDVSKESFRTKVWGQSGKDLVKDLRCYIFISTGINPNGIDSTGRIGRTWTINLELKGNARLYRRRSFDEVILKHFYGYAEAAEAIIGKFVEFLNSDDGRFIKSKMEA